MIRQLQRVHPVVYLSLLLLLTAAFFAQIRNFDFINLDDLYLVQGNGDWLRPFDLHNLLKPVAGLYHPLTNFTYWLDAHLWGTTPGAFHLTGLYFHLLSICGIYLWIERLTGLKFHALAFAACFAWHPSHVESVAWISERKDVVSVAFYFLALAAHAQSLRESRRIWLVISLAMAVLSLAGKPFALTLPAVVLWIERWKTEKSVSELLKRRKWFFALSSVASLLAAVLVLKSQIDVRANIGSDLLLLPAQLGFYLSTTFFPNNIKLVYEKNDLLPGVWSSLTLAAYFLGTFYAARKSTSFRKNLIFGWGFFILTIAPMLKIIPFGDDSPVNDRYLYVSQTGLLFPWIMALTGKLWQVAVTSSLLAACAALTLQRIPDWRDSMTLWESHLALDPNSPTAHEFLGRFFLSREKHERALSHLERGQTTNWENSLNQAFVLSRLGRLQEASRKLSDAEKLFPNDPKVLNLRGSLHMEHGDLAKAEEYFSRSLASQPTLLQDLAKAEAQTNMGVLAFRRGNNAGCIEWQNLALRSLPGYVYALHNRAACNYLTQNFSQAKIDYESIINIDPEFAMAYNGLGVIVLQEGHLDAAENYFRKALIADPNLAVASDNIAKVARLRASAH